MLKGRGFHGCAATTIKNQLNFMVFGGSFPGGAYNTIHLYNFDTQKWIVAPAPMALPFPVTSIKGIKIITMDVDGCDLMFVNSDSIYICSGRYNWTRLISGPIDDSKTFATVGANDLLPCGV